MKNETARREIESLDYYFQHFTRSYSEKSHMAMMTAIKALEQEPKTWHWIPLSNDIIKNGVDVLLKATDGDIYKTHLSITGTLPDGDEEELKNIEAFMIIKKETITETV